MKSKVVRVARKWLVGSALLAGFAYSVVALAVNTEPAYATSCNCFVEQQEATSECASHGGVQLFDCPVNLGPVIGDAWIVECNDGFKDSEVCSQT